MSSDRLAVLLNAAALLAPVCLYWISPARGEFGLWWLLMNVLMPAVPLIVLARAARSGRYHPRGIVLTAIAVIAGLAIPYSIWSYLYDWTNRGGSVNCLLAYWLMGLPLYCAVAVAGGLSFSRR